MASALGGDRREGTQAWGIHALVLTLLFAALCALFARRRRRTSTA